MQKTMIWIFFALLTLACFSLQLPVPGSNTHTVTVVDTTKAVKNSTIVIISPTPFPRCIVNTAVLNFRACAGIRCTAKAWLHKNEVLTILARKAPWIKVETLNGETGWVHSKFCTGE